MPFRSKRTTTTTLIVEALRRLDDFVTARGLCEATNRSANQVTAGLVHLKKHHVVAAVEQEGRLYWYLTGEDTRGYSIEEKAEETKPRKPRVYRSRKKQERS